MAALGLWILFVELLALSAASSLVVSVTLAFVTGFLASLILVFLLFYLGLDSAERYFEKKKDKFVTENKRTWNSSQVRLSVSFRRHSHSS